MKDKLTEILKLPETGYLRQSQLIPDILPFSDSTLWRMVKAKKFPSPVKLSERITGWKVKDVKEWLDNLEKTTNAA